MRDDSNTDVVSRWDNGSKANVSHLRDSAGIEYIRKDYRSGQFLTFCRELAVLKYLGSRISCVPSVLSFELAGSTTYLEYVAGERVLEWVLRKFSVDQVDLDSYKSFHGLETNKVVGMAFDRFKGSDNLEARALKNAIANSYRKLHREYFVHGDPSPRNLIFDGSNVTIIDFDHSRPSRKPFKIDGAKLEHWYGIS